MALSLGNQKGEHVGTHSAVQVDDAHKTAFSFIEQCVTREYLYFYGTVVILYINITKTNLSGKTKGIE
jgi:hypothetical protein